jgi:hypothetical protein
MSEADPYSSHAIRIGGHHLRRVTPENICDQASTPAGCPRLWLDHVIIKWVRDTEHRGPISRLEIE